MIRALFNAATGMKAQQLRIDVTSNNLANVNTTGFKRSRAEFEDLLYQTMRVPGAESGQGAVVPTGLQVGQGVRVVGTARDLSNGEALTTNVPTDMMGLILPFYAFIDMVETPLNIWSDVSILAVIDRKSRTQTAPV